MPTAESIPRESFLIRLFCGRSKSATSDFAYPASQFGNSMAAADIASATRKYSAYFWFSLTSDIRCNTDSFSYGFPPKTSMLPDVGTRWPASNCIMVVLPAPLRPSRPVMTFSSKVALTLCRAVCPGSAW